MLIALMAMLTCWQWLAGVPPSPHLDLCLSRCNHPQLIVPQYPWQHCIYSSTSSFSPAHQTQNWSFQLQPDLTVQSAPCHSSSRTLSNKEENSTGTREEALFTFNLTFTYYFHSSLSTSHSHFHFSTSLFQEALFTVAPDLTTLTRHSPRAKSPVLRLFSLESR